MQRQTLNAFSQPHNTQPQPIQAQPVKIAEGAYSIPVNINSSAKLNDPTLANYETPNFIHKSEKQLGGTAPYDINSLATNPASPLAIGQLPSYNAGSNLQNAVNNDITTFTHELAGNIRSTGEKVNIRKKIYLI
jgi:hypothetical protein